MPRGMTERSRKAVAFFERNPDATTTSVARRFKIAPSTAWVMKNKAKASNNPQTLQQMIDEYQQLHPEPVTFGPDPSDMVNSPSHYQIVPGVEVYDLRRALAKKATEQGIPHAMWSDWDRALEYLLRMWGKNKLQDLDKAMWYLSKLREQMEDEFI